MKKEMAKIMKMAGSVSISAAKWRYRENGGVIAIRMKMK